MKKMAQIRAILFHVFKIKREAKIADFNIKRGFDQGPCQCCFQNCPSRGEKLDIYEKLRVFFLLTKIN